MVLCPWALCMLSQCNPHRILQGRCIPTMSLLDPWGRPTVRVLVLGANGQALVCQPSSVIGCLSPRKGVTSAEKLRGDPDEFQLASFLPAGQQVPSWRCYLSSTFPCLQPGLTQIVQQGISWGYENLPCEPNKGPDWNSGLGGPLQSLSVMKERLF